MLFYLKELRKKLPYVVRHRNADGVNIITFHATSEQAETERRWRRMNGALRVRKIHLSNKEMMPCEEESISLQPIRFNRLATKHLRSAKTSTGGKSGTMRSVLANTGVGASASPMSV